MDFAQVADELGRASALPRKRPDPLARMDPADPRARPQSTSGHLDSTSGGRSRRPVLCPSASFDIAPRYASYSSMAHAEVAFLWELAGVVIDIWDLRSDSGTGSWATQKAIQ